MHYHLELIMPPTENVEQRVSEILSEFNENNEYAPYAFYDWYVIGGRLSGIKLEKALGEEKIEEFRKLLQEKELTVSSFRAGKESLNPPEQIPLVDKLWNDFFPDSPVKQCPLFNHYDGIWGDVMELKYVPDTLSAQTVLIAKHAYEGEGFDGEFLLHKDIWNGLTHQDTAFSGNVLMALNEYKDKIQKYSKEFIEKNTPQPNWLCVTIDYHH